MTKAFITELINNSQLVK